MSSKVLFFFILLMFSCKSDSIEKSDIDETWDLINRMQYDEAYEKLNKILEKDSNNISALINKGVVADKLGFKQEALNCYLKAYQIDSMNYNVNLNLGSYYLDVKDTIAAIKFNFKAIQINPESHAAYSNMGVLETNCRNFDSALKYHGLAIDKNPEFAGVYINRAATYLLKGDTALAMLDFEKALNCKKYEIRQITYLYNRRAIIYSHFHNYEKAIEDFSKSIELYDQDPHVFYYRGWAYYYMHNYKLALKDFKKVKKMGSTFKVDNLINSCEYNL